MRPKKNPEYNLERFRFPLFLMGIVFAASLVLSAFEWKTDDQTVTISGSPTIDFRPLDEVITIVPPKAPPKPPTRLKPAINGNELVQDILSIDVLSQNTSNESDFSISEINFDEEFIEEEPIVLDDEYASFPGGIDSLTAYLGKNITYPAPARENGVKGTVYIEFVVSETGKVGSPNILRGIGFGCDQIAIDLVKNMPNWNPARVNGKRVPVSFRLPVKFTLQ